ncbi:MAG: nucleotide exchange factor GrpE [Actinomycetota bacterium]
MSGDSIPPEPNDGTDDGEAVVRAAEELLEEEIQELDPLSLALAERDGYLDSLQRLQADFENYKKRVQRTQIDEVARAAGDLVTKLLAVIDTLDLAQTHLVDHEDAKAEAQALVAARAQLLEVLTKEGLVRVDEVGSVFDPSVHDAVMHAPADDGVEETVVDEVLRSGYVWRGQVLRPAMVKVKG